MDKKIKTKSAFFDGIKNTVRREADKRRASKTLILIDVAAFLVALFFARRHIVLGAYPLAIAWLSVLPSHVWVALPGAIFGALTLGSDGIILAVSSSSVVLFRLICSFIGGGKSEPFREGGTMRIGACALGSAIGAAYEMIIASFSPSSMIFASAQILLSVGLSMVFLGVFSYEIDFSQLLLSHSVFSVRREGRERVGFLVYLLSLLSFIFLITISLEGYDFFGISLSYLFVGAVTLFVARRFGAVRAMAVGFFSAVGINPVAAVGFALGGLVSGFLFDIGMAYGLVGGAAAISAWCAYAGGMSLFLSAIPEWGISCAVMIPYLRGAIKEKGEEKLSPLFRESEDLIRENIHRIRNDMNLSAASEKILLSAAVARDYFSSSRGELDEYRNAVIAATASLSPHPCEEKINELASLLFKNRSVSQTDIQSILGINYGNGGICSSLNAAVRAYENEIYKKGGKVVADEMERQAHLMQSREARVREALTSDEASAAAILERARLLGLSDGAVRVLGGRKRLVCLAARDDGTDRIRGREVISSIEDTLGTRLLTPSYKKRGETLLLEACEAARLDYEVGIAARPSKAGEPSGDSACFFERDGVLFAVLSDGMGTGEVAMQTSRLVCDYLREATEGAEDLEILISAINGIVVASGTECCASVDVFFLDLYTGESGFIKAGAVPSFLKKGDSVRRIRAKSAPIGAMEAVDTQRCVVDVDAGDFVIMMSDGVSEIPEESVWLIDFVSSKTQSDAQKMAEQIIALAEKNNSCGDDMSVMVVGIKRKR